MCPRLISTIAAFAVALTCSSAPALGDAVERNTDAVKAADDSGYRPATAGGGLSESEPNDDPATADDLNVGETISGVLDVGDTDLFRVPCSGGWLRVTTHEAGGAVDTVVRVLDDAGASVLAIDDDGGYGLFSSARHVACPTEGSVLVEVRHFSPEGQGDYLLTVELDDPPPPVPPNDDPTNAIKLKCNSATKGSTEGATNQLAGDGCLPFALDGGDVFYSVDVPYSFQLFVSVTPEGNQDPAVVLFTDPADPWGSCLVANDVAYGGEDELVSWHNTIEGPETVGVYIAVDSWSEAAGPFVLTVTCEFLIGTSSASFGAVKARY